MHLLIASILSILLTLLHAGTASLMREFYVNLVANARVAEKLRLLAPDSLLENYKIERIHRYIVNDACAFDLDIYIQAIGRNELWALEMLDASSRVPSGILQGNLHDFGAYDGCVKVKGQSISAAEIRGQYCSYSIKLECDTCMISLMPTLSICLPNSCTSEDLVDLIKAKVNVVNVTSGLATLPISAKCIDEKREYFHTKLVILMSLTSIHLGFLVVCTLYDIRQRLNSSKNHGSKLINTLIRFSLLRNAEKILSTETPKENLSVLNGMRFISTMSIVYFHEVLLHCLSTTANIFYLVEWVSSWKLVFPILKSFSVDTFLTLSGYLMACSFFRRVQRRSFSFVNFFLHRYIRLTLPMVAICGTVIMMVPKLGFGPQWVWSFGLFGTGCTSKWWSFIFQIHNLVEIENYCLLHTWTSAVDMQLFTVSLFVLWLLCKKPKLGLITIFLLISTSILYTAVLVGMNRYRTMIFFLRNNIKFILQAVNNIYLTTYARASPYFFGLLLGYKTHNQKLKISKINTFTGWTLVVMTLFIFAIFVRIMIDENYTYMPIFEILFSAFGRPVWSFMICWIIYNSLCDSKGAISKFLSWKYFLPLSRLSFCIYLTHPMYLWYHVTITRNLKYFSDYSIIHMFVSNLGTQLLIAFLCSLIYEMPISVIDDLIFNQNNEKDIKKPHVTRIENNSKTE